MCVGLGRSKPVQRLMTQIPNMNEAMAANSIKELIGKLTRKENETLAMAYLKKNYKMLLLGTEPPRRQNEKEWLPKVSILVPVSFDNQ